MTKTVGLLFLLTTTALAQLWIPEGTPVRVRLEQDLRRDQADAAGKPVEFTVVEQVWAQQKVAIAVGSPASGKLVLTKGKGNGRRSLDFTIDRVRAVDGSWFTLRYSPQKDAAANLVRSDYHLPERVDPKILLPHGAMFALYVEHPEKNIRIQPRKQRTLFDLLFGAEVDSESIWPSKYSKWSCVGGCVLIAAAFIYRARQDRKLKGALLARMTSSDNTEGWHFPYHRQVPPPSQPGSAC